MSSPTLSDMLRGALANHTSSLRVALPGRIETFDKESNKASVTVLIKDVYVDEYGGRQSAQLAIINDVPVCMPGSGKVRVRFPVSSGDTCLLIFSSSSLDLWLQRGDLVDPGDDRHHDENDAICIPGLNAFNNSHDDDIQIEFTDSEIHAWGSAALATKSDIDALRTYITTHIHPTGVGPSGPPSTPPPSAVGTQVLKGS